MRRETFTISTRHQRLGMTLPCGDSTVAVHLAKGTRVEHVESPLANFPIRFGDGS